MSHHNQPSHTDTDIPLEARAHKAMLDYGFEPDLQQDALRQLQEIDPKPLPPDDSLRDLRHLLWSSIDNRESRDLDQIEVAEQLQDGNIRILVGIADVDSRIQKGTPLDHHAYRNTTSVYLGVAIFPMLPELLSTDLTSMNPDVERHSLVVDMVVDIDGEVKSAEIYRALTFNHAKLSYDPVGDWLNSEGSIPESVSSVDGLEAQLLLQHQAAQRLRIRRYVRGALDFETIEATPVMENGKVVDLVVPHKNPARYLIEDFMIAANSTIAEFLERSGCPSIQRIVRSPERWPRIVDIAAHYHFMLPAHPDPRSLSEFLKLRREADPLRFPDLSLTIVKLMGSGEYTLVRGPEDRAGHFGLAATSYTHSTAPNRRYPDLITQRLLKSFLHNDCAAYSEAELEDVAMQCTERENAARKVERLMRKVAAAALLEDRIGDVFEAIVTGASYKGVYARLLSPPVEGRVVKREHGLDVGDRTRVRLLAIDMDKGYIDFQRL